MRGLRINMQRLHYSLYSEQITIYEKDSDGNIIYDEIDGEFFPRIIAERAGYGEPKEFYANISMSSGEVNHVEYGFDIGSYEAVLVTTDKTLSLNELSLIWHTTEPVVGANGVVDEATADYSVIAVKPSPNFVRYLLKKRAK